MKITENIIDSKMRDGEKYIDNNGELINGYEEELTNELYEVIMSKNIEIDPRTYDDIFEKDITNFILNSVEIINESDDFFVKEDILANHKFLIRYFICVSRNLPISGLSDKYMDYMHRECKKRFSVKRLYQISYIKKYGTEEDKKIIFTNGGKNTNQIIKKIKITKEENDDKVDQNYSSYETRCKRHIEGILKLYISGSKINNTDKLNCLDYCFISFLIETFSDKIIHNLKNEMFHKIDKYYRVILWKGIRSLAKYHFNVSDDELSNIDLKLNPEKFIPINKLETEVEKLLENIKTIKKKKINSLIWCEAINDVVYYNNKMERAIQGKTKKFKLK